MTRITILIFLFVMLFQRGFAQHANIMISNADWPEEPSIFIDQNNTNYIITATNIDKYFYSYDGGLTWEDGILTSPYGIFGDPCVVVDTTGSFYFFHLSNPPSGNWIDRIVCQKSTDYGKTWNQGSYMGLNGDKAQDKHWAVVNYQNNDIYVTWTQFDDYGSDDPYDSSIIRFSKSTDSGISWSEPVRLSEKAGDCLDGDNTTEGAVPAVGPNGEIYVTWALGESVMFDRSLDGGETWLDHDILVSDMPGGWDIDIPGISRCNGMPVTACDLSEGPYRGTLYINWADIRNGPEDTDIWLAKSTDGGSTWSAPQRVNDDPPGKQQFFTWMTIDQTNGYLYFVFYDRRYYNDNLTDVYMAVSRDGGETFINFKISESPFMPVSYIFFGDYNNISAHNNIIRPIWTRYQPGQLSVWTALVNPDIVGIKETEKQVPFSLEQNYPNPFTEITRFRFKLKSPAVISLKVRDSEGREIKSILDHVYRREGKYVEYFDPSGNNLPPGTYYIELCSDKTILEKKMIYVK